MISMPRESAYNQNLGIMLTEGSGLSGNRSGFKKNPNGDAVTAHEKKKPSIS